MNTALEELQLPPNAAGPVKQVRLSIAVASALNAMETDVLSTHHMRAVWPRQVLPQRPQATAAVGWLASPAGLRRPPHKQPSDHSYALLNLDSLKKKLFLTLKENEKLRKRLQAQKLVMQRMSTRLRACKGHWGLQARLRPEQQS
ncbi:THAP domain-containing protein 3 [Saguinus oedipus]|uniref:THAP domain-containing protein 3 n=1 Tax=Saguinus oedipus TaxID=9490 RepID=A0ABQ9VA94_SAGOE|nr:THAP domain-containing protein 3 [Saguinus oedipus]